MPQVQGAIKCGLTSHGRQNRIGFFFGDDFLNCLPSDRLNVSHIRRFGVGHDGGRIAVDQNDFIALFAQRLAGLNTRVIKFTSLPNHDGASTNDQNTLKVESFRHV